MFNENSTSNLFPLVDVADSHRVTMDTIIDETFALMILKELFEMDR